MSGKNIAITVAVVLAAAAVVGANVYFTRDSGLTVTALSCRGRSICRPIASRTGFSTVAHKIHSVPESSGQIRGRCLAHCIRNWRRVSVPLPFLEVPTGRASSRAGCFQLV